MKVGGAFGPPAASPANAWAVSITLRAVPRGIVTVVRAALRAVRMGRAIRSEAPRTRSIPWLGWSGSQGSSGTAISVPSWTGRG